MRNLRSRGRYSRRTLAGVALASAAFVLAVVLVSIVYWPSAPKYVPAGGPFVPIASQPPLTDHTVVPAGLNAQGVCQLMAHIKAIQFLESVQSNPEYGIRGCTLVGLNGSSVELQLFPGPAAGVNQYYHSDVAGWRIDTDPDFGQASLIRVPGTTSALKFVYGTEALQKTVDAEWIPIGSGYDAQAEIVSTKGVTPPSITQLIEDVDAALYALPTTAAPNPKPITGSASHGAGPRPIVSNPIV